MSCVKTSRVLIASVALLVCSGAARASVPFRGPFPDWAKAAVHERDSEPNRNSLPRDYAVAEVVGLLRPQPLLADDKVVEIPWTVLVKPWRSSPGLSVAAMEVRTFRNSKDEIERRAGGRVYLAVFSGGPAGATAEVKARTSVPIGETERLDSLDLAAYRLTKDKIAIGLRTTRPFDEDGTDGFLTLFLAEGEKLRPVWSTVLMHFSRYSALNDDDVREWFTEGCDEPAAIVVLKSSSHGFFRLRKTSKDFAVDYRWDGTKYVPDADDFQVAPSMLISPSTGAQTDGPARAR